MNDYYEVRFDLSPCSEDATDLLAAMLADVGYESFVPDSEGVNAYVKAELYDIEAIRNVITEFPIPDTYITIGSKRIEGQDWNAEWERNYFQPIVIGDKCVIHSSFHTDIPKAEYDIVIDPKMAFGTGHHSTTSLIVEQLLQADLAGKSVIDMGTGTGILAILAAMRGATDVTAIEIDGFAYENACENVRVNGHPEIKVINGDATALDNVAPAEVFIANINRNVITGDIAAYAARLKQGGIMLLSGFYDDDVAIVEAAAKPYGLVATGTTVKSKWACLQLIKA
jgi:ribosomal protein L11 methyltransferase